MRRRSAFGGLRLAALGDDAATKSVNARLGGALAHSAGSSFEKLLTFAYLEPMLRAGILKHFVRIHPEAIVVHRDARGRALCQFSARAAADWVAVTSAGVYVALEAKSSAGTRLARREIAPQQEQHLDAAAGTGLALLLIELRGAARAVYAVPWPAPWVRLRSADSLGEPELRPYLVTHWQQLAKRLRKAPV